MANEPLIERATTTSEKGLTYRENLKRLNSAMRNGFYYEALLIDGALIEDRIHSYLYYLSVFANRSDRSACKRTKAQLRRIQDQYTEPKSGLMVGQISAKINLIRATILWFKDHECAPADDPYLHALWTQYNTRIDADEVLSTLARIDAWREGRNEVIHDLMSKSMPAVDDVLSRHCQEGQELFRAVDSYVSRVKYRNVIRRAANLPTTRKV